MPHRRSFAFAACFVLVAACGKSDAADAAGNPDSLAADTLAGKSTLALPVVGEEVRMGDLVLTVTAQGQLRTDASASLKAEASGTVQRMLVRAGDRVRRGQALMRFDPRPFDLAVDEAQAAVRAAEVSYMVEIGPDSIATGKAPTQARRDYAISRSGLEGAKVRLARAKLERERAVITAPFDGIIERVGTSVGERISAGQEVAVVVDLSNLRVEADVLEHDLPLLRVGGEAFITVPAAPDKPVHGRIAAILPMVDSTTRAGRVIIRVRGDGTMRPGMYASARLEAARLPNRIIVPTSAVVEREGRPLVFTVVDDHAEWVYIQQGRSNGRDTEILPDSATGEIPLTPGMIVLTEGHRTLSHLAPVRLTAKREADPN
ncbi:MAG: efflux RND transporter periplasmic adaptor subunit [Gemmatimonadales bacterium]|nr:efflux RND transporter periplasmic adaptor subunit [Gemmatimonadales bacterium]